MLVKFTNGAEQFKGNDLFINLDHIVAVYEFTKELGTDPVTIVYGGTQGSEWAVGESLAETVKRIQAANKKSTSTKD